MVEATKPTRDLVPLAFIAGLTGFSADYLRKLARRGRLPGAGKPFGGHWRVSLNEFKRDNSGTPLDLHHWRKQGHTGKNATDAGQGEGMAAAGA